MIDTTQLLKGASALCKAIAFVATCATFGYLLVLFLNWLTPIMVHNPLGTVIGIASILTLVLAWAFYK